jgi:hypothetical protein
LIELVNGRPVVESLVFPGTVPPSNLVDYVEDHRAAVIPGASSRLGLVPSEVTKRRGCTWDGVGYRLRDRGYRRGWTIVGADLYRHLVGISPSWKHSRERGAWSVNLPGLGKWNAERFIPHGDAPRLILTPISRAVFIRWGTTRPMNTADDDATRHRPPPKRGPFVDVLVLAGALSGSDDVADLTTTCALFGVEPQEEATEPIDRLRAEAAAITRLYRVQLARTQDMQLNLDASTLMSTAGIATALLREAGVRP